jgi:F-type H+-transporting ATPase subunit b
MPNAELWVAIAFICFLGLLAFLGAHRKIIEALDRRQGRVKAELDEALRLKIEAGELLAEFERKGHEAEGEALALIANARAEAERLAGEAKSRMEDFIARRTKMMETRIAQTEARALADVRAVAADAAVSLASKMLSETIRGDPTDGLVAQSIKHLKVSKLGSAHPRA